MAEPVVDGKVYGFINKKTNLAVDAHQAGDGYTREWNAGGYQKWKAVQRNADGTVAYILYQTETNKVLDANAAGVVSTNPDNGGYNQRWFISRFPNAPKFVRVQNVQTKRFLDGTQGGGLNTNDWNGGDNQGWSLRLPDISWRYSVREIVFKDAGNHTYRVEDVAVDDVGNGNGKATIKTEWKKIEKQTLTFEWGLQQRIGTSVTVTTTAGLPMLASLQGSTTLSFDLNAHQTWTTSQEISYEFRRILIVPPNTSVHVVAQLKIAENAVLPFTVKVVVSATEGDNALSGAELRKLLESNPEFTGVIERQEDDHLLVSLDGKLEGSFGTATDVQVSDPVAL